MTPIDAPPERARLRLAAWGQMTDAEKAAVVKWLAAESRLPPEEAPLDTARTNAREAVSGAGREAEEAYQQRARTLRDALAEIERAARTLTLKCATYSHCDPTTLLVLARHIEAIANGAAAVLAATDEEDR